MTVRPGGGGDRLHPRPRQVNERVEEVADLADDPAPALVEVMDPRLKAGSSQR